jgi:alkanesulfonate monooxygenase SsuD/methylene tetrahydromethanopterin reductase-like flavin-dependent oxidoreductase (luciferase family)
VKIGIGLPNQVRDVRPAVIPGWAAKAEEAGFSTLATVGRVAYSGVMDTVALAAAAGATARIGLLSGITVATVWPAALLAKEAAGIDGVSGGRLTLGVGVGIRTDDFVADGPGYQGRGKRFDHDLEVYRDIWAGKPVSGSSSPAVPQGTRQVPLLFGATTPPAYARMARWGQGYVGPSIPVEMAVSFFDSAKDAWQKEGRAGSPRLVALAYFAFEEPAKGRENVYDYYSVSGPAYADIASGGVHVSAQGVRDAVKAYADLGVDELIFDPATDDIDEVSRLAEVVL